MDPADDEFLPNLMEEFPHLYLAPETIQKMWVNHQKQSTSISKTMEEEKIKKSKAKATVSTYMSDSIGLLVCMSFMIGPTSICLHLFVGLSLP